MNESKILYTVGQIAKLMNVSIRTIQYYDQQDLLSPSAYSKNNHRLYSHQDILKLDQILRLKQFGFSLSQIKDQLMEATSLSQIDEYLKQQEKIFDVEIKKMRKKKEVISKFRKEMSHMTTLDWPLLIEIVSMLQNDDEHYWVVKHFDKDMYEKIKTNFEKKKGEQFYATMEKYCDEVLRLKQQNIAPNNPLMVEIAKKWWDTLLEFTNNDMELIQQMTKISDDKMMQLHPTMKKFKEIETDIRIALETYFNQQHKEDSYD